MKTVGIILLILQAIAVFGASFNGGLFSRGIFQLIGFFLPTIVGVVLIVKANNKDKKN